MSLEKQFIIQIYLYTTGSLQREYKKDKLSINSARNRQEERAKRIWRGTERDLSTLNSAVNTQLAECPCKCSYVLQTLVFTSRKLQSIQIMRTFMWDIH